MNTNPEYQEEKAIETTNGTKLDKETESQIENFRRIIEFHDNALARVLQTFQWSITALISLIIGSGVLIGYQNWRYQESLKEDQKTLKDELKNDISERLGKLNADPNLELLNTNGQPLEKTNVVISRIIATNRDSQGQKIPITEVNYVYPLFFKNSGEGLVEYVVVKVNSDNFKTATPSTIKSYKYEQNITLYNSSSNEKRPIIYPRSVLSENLKVTTEVKTPLPNGEYRLPNGIYPVRISIVYPSKQLSSYEFNLIIDDSSEYISFRK
jgi:hypothetical protein